MDSTEVMGKVATREMQRVAALTGWKVGLVYDPTNKGADDPTRWVASVGGLVYGMGRTPEEALIGLQAALMREGWVD